MLSMLYVNVFFYNMIWVVNCTPPLSIGESRDVNIKKNINQPLKIALSFSLWLNFNWDAAVRVRGRNYFLAITWWTAQHRVNDFIGFCRRNAQVNSSSSSSSLSHVYKCQIISQLLIKVNRCERERKLSKKREL